MTPFEQTLAEIFDFTVEAFGPGLRTEMVVDHIRRELIEIEAEPTDLEEWVDVIMLGLGGAMRTGATPRQVIGAIQAKLQKNKSRTWPDWRTTDTSKAIEHIPDPDDR